MTLPDGSVAIVYKPHDSEFAIGLAEACGADGAHRKSVGEFVDLEEACTWGV